MPVLTRRAKIHACHIDALPLELVAEVLYRTPFYSHDILRATCTKFKAIVDSADDFHESRLALGHADSALFAFGGYSDAFSTNYHRGMAALVDGQWVYLADPPAWGKDLYHGLLGDRLVLIGGGQFKRDDEQYPEGLQVHTYDVVSDRWNPVSPKNPPALSRQGAACAAVGDRIVIAGARSSKASTRLAGPAPRRDTAAVPKRYPTPSHRRWHAGGLERTRRRW